MGKIVKFGIHLQKPYDQTVYIPGEPLVGTLSFLVQERCKIHSVRMLITGKSSIDCIGGKKGDSAKEYYLNETMIFMEKNPNQELILEPGEYSFPFNFPLPRNLPTSFEHKTGYIRYSLHGIIRIPWSSDKHAVLIFSILNHLDLNILPGDLRRSREVSDDKKFGCGPFLSAPITGELTINKTGFVPGELIQCNVSISNNSSYNLKPAKVSLIQETVFRNRQSLPKTKMERSEIVTVENSSPIKARSNQEWEDIIMLIPPVYSSITLYTPKPNFIKVSYKVVLFIQAYNRPFYSTKELSIPIIIGNKPLIDRSQSVNNTGIVLTTSTAVESEDLPPEYNQIVGENRLS